MHNLILLILHVLWTLIRYKLCPKICWPSPLGKNDCCRNVRKRLFEKWAIRWSKKATDHHNEETPASFETEQQQDPLSGIPTDPSMDPHIKALLDLNTSSSESESESSSDDDDHKKKRKVKKLKKSIPKAVRRRLDKYLRMKLEESRRDVPLDTREEYDDPMPPHNPVLARTPHYTAPINFLWLVRDTCVLS